MKINMPLSLSTVNKVVSILMIILAIVLARYIVDIQYRSDIEDYFADNEPAIFDYKTLKSNFSSQDSLLLMVSLSGDDNTAKKDTSTTQTILDFKTLQIFRNYVLKIQASKYVESTASILDATVTLETKDGQQNHLLSEAITSLNNSAEYHIITSQIQDNLSGKSFLLSSDNRNTVIDVVFSKQIDGNIAYQHLIDSLRQDTSAANHFEIKPWGSLAIKSALHESLLHDGIYLFPIILLSGIVLLYLFIGSVSLISSGIITIILALLLTLEFTGIMQATLNQTSILAFGIVFIISLADVIHVLMCYQSQKLVSTTGSIGDAIRKKLLPLCLTTITTGIGFFSLDFADSPTFSTFGFIAASGVFFALMTTLFVLPVIVSFIEQLFPARNTNPPRPPPALSLLNTTINYLISILYRSKSLLLIALIGVSFLLTIGLSFNTYHNDSLTYFQEDSDIRQSTREFENAFSTHQGLAIVLSPANRESFYDSTTTQLVVAFHQWLTHQPWASIHTSYTQTLTNIQRGLHENDFRWQHLSKDPAQIAELFSLYEMAGDNNSLHNLGINPVTGKILISVGIPEMLNRDVLALKHDIEAWFLQHSSSVDVAVSGQAILFAKVGWQLTQDMLVGAALTLTVITLLIGVFFRSAPLALLSIIPNLFPAMVCLGAVGWLSGKINFAIAGSISMALGIVVDDTIHILSEYRRQRKNGHSSQQSMETTMLETGPALILTTLVLSVGFSILNFALFIPNQHTAQMITAMVSSAIVYDFLLLPFLLLALDSTLFPAHQNSTLLPQPQQLG